MESEEEHMGVI